MSTDPEPPRIDPVLLDPDPGRFRAFANDVVERVTQHLATLATQPARGDMDVAALCRSLREPVPEAGADLEPLLAALFEQWLPRSFNTAGPGYLAFIPGGGIPTGALADLISGVTNRFTGIWNAAPALVQLEANALEWFRAWMGFPVEARGLLTTGGSMANFTAIVCAREKLLGPDIRPGVVYASSQVHHSVIKAARLAGVAPDRVRSLPVDARLRLRLDALGQAIAADRAAGLRPFLVVSSAGTTNTGAVDPMAAIGDLCGAEGMWHHVDGAYGAFFHLCDELRPALAGLARADSLTLDPHKGLFLPYGTGALLVRDGEDLRRAHAATAGYLPDAPAAEFYDPAQYGPDLSRDNRGLRVWLTIKHFGAARLRAALREKHLLAAHAARRLVASGRFELVTPLELSLFAFRLKLPAATPLAERNRRNRELIERVTQRGKVMLTGCTVAGEFLPRICVLSFRTHQDRVDIGVDHLVEEAER